MTHYSATSTGKPTQPANLSTPLLALLREHTGKPWEIDPNDPTMAILRVPIIDLVQEQAEQARRETAVETGEYGQAVAPDDDRR